MKQQSYRKIRIFLVIIKKSCRIINKAPHIAYVRSDRAVFFNLQCRQGLVKETVFYYYTVSCKIKYFLCQFGYSIINILIIVHRLYPIRVSPFAGAVFPALDLSSDPIIPGISPGNIFPSPTSISVPAMIRTMLYKNPLPVT